VAGLSCVVVGNTDGLAGPLAAYLTQAGATVHRALTLIDARQHADNYPPGLSVWLLTPVTSDPLRRSYSPLFVFGRMWIRTSLWWVLNAGNDARRDASPQR